MSDHFKGIRVTGTRLQNCHRLKVTHDNNRQGGVLDWILDRKGTLVGGKTRKTPNGLQV